MMKNTKAQIAAALAVVLSLVTITIVIEVSQDEGGKPKGKVTVKVDGADRDRARDEKVTAPKTAVDQANRSIERSDHDDLRVPPSVTPEKQRQQIRSYERRSEDPPQAGAAQTQRGCKTALGGNSSPRRARVAFIALHYTVGPNRPGWSDVNGYIVMGSRPSSGVGWNYVIDREGNCAYTVAENRAAWTQAGANQPSVSIEVVNTGREGTYMDPAGYRKLAIVVRDIARRHRIPLRLGRPNGCVPGLSGIVQHKQFGICGGGHVDITPFSISQVVRIIRAGAPVPVTAKLDKGEQRIRRRRCHHFRERFKVRRGSAEERAHHRWSRHYKARAGARKRFLTRLGNYRIRNRGIRRKLMARTEAFRPSHRRQLC